MVKPVFADLHVHLGEAPDGRPVKITASSQMTIERVASFAKNAKGLDVIGVIDAHVPSVQTRVEEKLASSAWTSYHDGGIDAGGITLILGVELELAFHGRLFHFLAYFKYLDDIKAFTNNYLQTRVKNLTLSTQRVYDTPEAVLKAVRVHGGFGVVAHAFTPFKSLYGNAVERSIEEVFPKEIPDAVEIGLSADAVMADRLTELHKFPFLANSDAHSLENIGREYQELYVQAPTFQGVISAIQNGGVKAYCGLQPLLGKYYDSACAACGTKLSESAPNSCSFCGSSKVIQGVRHRLEELACENTVEVARPPYIHHVPLKTYPGIGPKRLERLREHVGPDLYVLHEAEERELKQVLPNETAAMIARKDVAIESGAGGTYGKVKRTSSS
ncbi:uncharacterized protein (TIGR00375 family) [Salsuginibacillus halophilus]|uniref:Uncharacterized protein (TIGR00375 family) n=1 Tax=Salsuginibacillus halophilus TaxID=517424 RepID=A0A2P8HAM7_9BACI|nr:endonuclease Q family protein [Salsuginibacillus halophilus]PSL43285.1 uncharacterized protein (TIGR00375 family) [Salsuginibacillus halophilus]